MSTVERLIALSSAAERELREDILPFWAERTVDREKGGFYGLITNDLEVDSDAPKGSVLNTRILWTFSAAFRTWPEPLYREMADRAYAYLLEHFWAERTVDREKGGFYGLITNDLKVDSGAPKGSVLNTRILWTFSAAFRTWPEPLYREMADRAY